MLWKQVIWFYNVLSLFIPLMMIHLSKINSFWSKSLVASCCIIFFPLIPCIVFVTSLIYSGCWPMIISCWRVVLWCLVMNIDKYSIFFFDNVDIDLLVFLEIFPSEGVDMVSYLMVFINNPPCGCYKSMLAVVMWCRSIGSKGEGHLWLHKIKWNLLEET